MATDSSADTRRVTVKDLAPTNPGTIAGRYLRSFWQPIYEVRKLPAGRAVPIEIMGERWALYRGDTGAFHVLADQCAHRGARLSVGWVEGDELRCFYHGWKYDPQGRCTEQPAELKPTVHRMQVRSAPAREYIGLVWAYFGEGAPPELPRYPEFENCPVLSMYTKHAFNYFNSIDNLLDASHLGFVHADHPGGFDGRVDSPVIEPEETCWGATSRHTRRKSGKVGQTQFGMPNVTRARIFPLAPDLPLRDILIWFVPENDESNHRFYVETARMSQDKLDAYVAMRERMLSEKTPPGELAEAVMEGRLNRADVDPKSTVYPVFVDDVALISQGRIADRTAEHLAGSDAGVVLVRKIWMRELSAFAQGKPLTPWRYDPTLPLRQADEEG